LVNQKEIRNKMTSEYMANIIKQTAWKKAYNAWSKMMYYEAAERGYDAHAAAAARAEFNEQKARYEIVYGEWKNEQ
jgi:hypothetical protein